MHACIGGGGEGIYWDCNYSALGWRMLSDLVFGVWGFIHSSSLGGFFFFFFLFVSSNLLVSFTLAGREEGCED